MKHFDHLVHLFRPKTIIIVSLALASLAIFWQLANRSLTPSKAASLGEATVTFVGEDNKDVQMYVLSAIVKSPISLVPSGMGMPSVLYKISGIDVTFDIIGDIQMGPPTLTKVEEYGSSPASVALEEVVKDVTNGGKRVHLVYVDRKSTSELPPAVIIKFPLIRTSPAGGTIRIINNQSDIAFDVTGMDPTRPTADLPLAYDVDRLDPKKYSYLIPLVLPSPPISIAPSQYITPTLPPVLLTLAPCPSIFGSTGLSPGSQRPNCIPSPSVDMCKDAYGAVKNYLGSACGDGKYDPRVDINKDGRIDSADLGRVTENLDKQAWCNSKAQDAVSPCGNNGSVIQVDAAGTGMPNDVLHTNIYPDVELRIDDKVVAMFKQVQGNPEKRDFQEFTYLSPIKVLPSQVKVAFINDAYDPGAGDINLRVDKIYIDGKAYESEDSMTYVSSCDKGVLRTEWLYCNGYFQYGFTNASPTNTPSSAPQYTGIPPEPTVRFTIIPTYTPGPTGESVCLTPVQGDADCNGKIDMIDFEIFRKEMVGELKTFKGDFNKNKRIDIVDFEIWRANFFKPKGNVNSSVEVP